MADDDPPVAAPQFYTAFSKISSRFGSDGDDIAADDVTDGTKVPEQRPADSHRLTIYVEHCTARRPTHSLKGSNERYVEARSTLEMCFAEQFNAEGGWAASQVAFHANPPADKSPYSFVPCKEAAAYQLRLNSLEAPCYLHELGESTRLQLKAGTMVLDASEFPPRLLKYPRIGAFEVTFELCEGRTPIETALAFSKLTSKSFPNCRALVREIASRVQRALYKHTQSSQRVAHVSRELAAQRAETLAEASAAAEAAEREHPEDAAALTGTRRAVEAARVGHLEALAQAEVAEARRAMQTARKELREWEESLKTLEEALAEVEGYAVRGDSTSAAAMRDHADGLRKDATRELNEARDANEAATKELLEAVHAEHAAAEARLALCTMDAANGAASEKALGRAHEEVREALVHIEDAEAQAAMSSADLEFREARSYVFQARLAKSEAMNAPEGDAKLRAARTATKLSRRATYELQDAHEMLQRAAAEAVEAAEARCSKEAEEHRQAEQQLVEAEAEVVAARGSSKPPELLARVASLKAAAQLEGRQAAASKLNLDLTRREIADKQSEMERVWRAHVADEQAEAEKERKRQLANEAKREREEAKAAEAHARDADENAQEADAKAAAASAHVDAFEEALGSTALETLKAIEAEKRDLEIARKRRTQAEAARASADRELREARVAEMTKEEEEAIMAYQRYAESMPSLDELRQRTRDASEQLEEATASGETVLATRAAATLSELQGRLLAALAEAAVHIEDVRVEAADVARVHTQAEAAEVASLERAHAFAEAARLEAEGAIQQREAVLKDKEMKESFPALHEELLRDGQGKSTLDGRRALHQPIDMLKYRIKETTAATDEAHAKLETQRKQAAEWALGRSEQTVGLAQLMVGLVQERADLLRQQLQAAQQSHAAAAAASAAAGSDGPPPLEEQREAKREVKRVAHELRGEEKELRRAESELADAEREAFLAQPHEELREVDQLRSAASVAEAVADSAMRKLQVANHYKATLVRELTSKGYNTYDEQLRRDEASRAVDVARAEAERLRGLAFTARASAVKAHEAAKATCIAHSTFAPSASHASERGAEPQPEGQAVAADETVDAAS